ncbi:hypothetical protein OL229_14485 [Neisseriaceae bacterium JH1-16]|nr:hypothetical protein [Neisseriaceae bacterium JH1-16]
MRKADRIYWLLMTAGVVFVLTTCLLAGASLLGADSLHWDSLRNAVKRFDTTTVAVDPQA